MASRAHPRAVLRAALQAGALQMKVRMALVTLDHRDTQGFLRHGIATTGTRFDFFLDLMFLTQRRSHLALDHRSGGGHDRRDRGGLIENSPLAFLGQNENIIIIENVIIIRITSK